MYFAFVFVDSCMPPKDRLESLKKYWRNEIQALRPRSKIGADGTVITYWCELRELGKKAMAGGM